MKSRLASMLQLQDAMNTKVNEDWRKQGFPWYRAIWVECAELLDHYGWKWWKQQEPDIEQVKLELIDIWHFGLSQLLLEQSDQSLLIDQLASAFAKTPDSSGDFRAELETFTLSTLATRRFNPSEFVVLLRVAGLDFEELYTRYIGKNVLNFFRQDHGYIDGSYRKNWGGREDNEHLVELTATLNASAPEFMDDLYKALAERYASFAE